MSGIYRSKPAVTVLKVGIVGPWAMRPVWGAAACAIPVKAYAAIPAELMYFMRELYNSVLGLGHLMRGHVHKDDFAVVLAKWSGEYQLSDEQVARAMRIAQDVASEFAGQTADEAAKYAWRYVRENWDDVMYGSSAGTGTVAAVAPSNQESGRREGAPQRNTSPGNERRKEQPSQRRTDRLKPQSRTQEGGNRWRRSRGQQGSQWSKKTANRGVSNRLTSKMIAKKSGAKVSGKVGAKVATKVAAKFATKLTTQGWTAWIPGVSAAVCASMNAWIMTGVMDAAWDYYSQLNRVERRVRTYQR